MAVATTDRLTVIRDGFFYRNVPMAAAVNVPTNTVGTVSATGAAGPSSNATYNRVLGVVEDGADNTGGLLAAKTVNIRRNIAATFDNSLVNPVLPAHIGQVVKWEDNQTVAAPATASLPAGGVILGITPDGVEIYFP